jgi:UDP-glucuronate 4-epimerase
MRLLVTGAAGFIGSHLVDRLLGRGDEVCAFDNFNDFYDPRVKRRNVEAHSKHPKYRMIEGDLRDPAAVKSCFAKPVDLVVHLAAMAGVRPSLKDPGLYVDVNLRGTINLYDAAVAAGVKKVVFASSSSVYGANKKVPFSESDPVDNPVSPYAATKKAGELLSFTYHHIHGLSITNLRFFTVYGPRQRPEMAIHNFFARIDRGQPIPVFGDGSSRRDYTYIDDIVDGVVRSIDRCGGYRIYNLGESQTISLNDLVAALEVAVGKKAVVDRQPDQPGDVPVTFADVSLAKRELGYDPHTDVRTGLAHFAKWYRGENR